MYNIVLEYRQRWHSSRRFFHLAFQTVAIDDKTAFLCIIWDFYIYKHACFMNYKANCIESLNFILRSWNSISGDLLESLLIDGHIRSHISSGPTYSTCLCTKDSHNLFVPPSAGSLSQKLKSALACPLMSGILGTRPNSVRTLMGILVSHHLPLVLIESAISPFKFLCPRHVTLQVISA